MVGPSAVEQVLRGKHYNRALRCHRTVMEAMFRMKWQMYQEWLESKQVPADTNLLQSLSKLRSHVSFDTISSLSLSPGFQKVASLYDEYCSQDVSPTATFWSSYIDMVTLLLQFIESSRQGDWDLHLACIRAMLPYMFAYDRVNYSRYMSYYWLSMITLKSFHPSADADLRAGECAVQRSNSLRQVPFDLAIEQSVNRDTKMAGGIIGFSRKAGAVQRWVVNAHEKAEITSDCCKMAGVGSEAASTSHHDTLPSRIRKDEVAVEAVLGTLETWQNPFAPTDGLVNISSGVVATDSVKKDLLNAVDIGEEALLAFIRDRLQSSTIGFFEKIQSKNLATFSSMNKPAKKQDKSKVAQVDRALIARMLVVAQSRSMDMRYVLQFSLSPLPLALANADGSLAKTNKAKMLTLLEAGIASVSTVPSKAVWVIDGMAVLQSITSPPATFAALAEIIFRISTSSFNAGGERVDFVADQYPNVSIKNNEWHRRQRGNSYRVEVTRGEQHCPVMWKSFLSHRENKIQLLSLLLQLWAENKYAACLFHRKLYVAVGETCFILTSNDGQSVLQSECAELSSTHEEADTRLLLHAAHAARDAPPCIVVRSPDTDVAIISCFAQRDIAAPVYFRTGTKHRTRFVDISAVTHGFSSDMCSALLGVHALTGCDSTSAFVGKGKAAAFQLLSKSPQIQQNLSSLGVTFTVSEELHQHCEEFVCTLYGSREDQRC